MDKLPIFSSPLLGTAVTFGNLAIWIGLAAAVTCVVLYWAAMIRHLRLHPEGSRAVEPAAGAENGKAANGKTNGGGNGKKARASHGETLADEKTDRIGLWARRAFLFSCGCMVVGALCLWALILNQQYTVAYVHKNSNNDLPFGYRFASFWSDQQGTFFLWGLYNMVLGSVLLWKARADERWVMPFFTLINVSLFTLLCFMNPFWLLPPAEVRAGLESAGAPADALSFLPHTQWQHVLYYMGWAQYWPLTDGRGLNESLRNFWMVIHPPTLFVGYSSMIVPSAFALGALMRRDYDGWVQRAAPWLAFSWAVLGTGIFLGAYWAYETLGWGGYWSWDPVENSSIIPWFLGTALIHGLLGQRNRGNFKQANLFLGVLAGVSVLLSSFLVRSGVLTETSVHAFASPQHNVFVTLLVILALWFVMSVAIWLWRFKDIQSEIAYEHIWERHFGFFLGLIVLSASAAVITFGVTLPIWKPWIPGGKLNANVDYTFYNKSLLPVVFVVVLLMGLTPLMPWRRTGDRPLALFSKAMLVLSTLVTVFFLGAAVYAWQGAFKTQNDPAYLAFGLMMALALVANAVCLKRAARGGFLNTGPWLAHIGFLVMLGGVVLTSRFNSTHPVLALEKGEGVQLLGRQFVYQGQRERDKNVAGDKDRMLIDMVKDGKTQSLAPKLFITRQNGEAQLMAWPQIIHEWVGGAWGDVYVEPSGVDNGSYTIKELKKGTDAAIEVQHKKKDVKDQVLLTFDGLDMAGMQKAMRGGADAATIYADVRLNINGEEKTLRPGLKISGFTSGMPTKESLPVRVEGLHQGTGYSLELQTTNMNPSDLNANFALVPDEKVERGYFQVLHVPGIQVLWWGCYLMFFGAFLCYRRRTLLARRPAPAAPTTPAGERSTDPRPDRAPTPALAGAE